MKLESYIRSIPDFPRPGVVFRDIAPLPADGSAFCEVINRISMRYQDREIDQVVGIEARGFLLASAMAYALGAGTGLIRKAGKLPHATHCREYELEYGSSVVEIHKDALRDGQRILLVDDVLATGGTAAAAADLIREHFSVTLEAIVFLIELDELNGRANLPDLPIHSLFHF